MRTIWLKGRVKVKAECVPTHLPYPEGYGWQRGFPPLFFQSFFCDLFIFSQSAGLGGGSPAARPGAAFVAAAAAEAIVVASTPIAAVFVAAASPPLTIVIPSASAAAP